VEFDVERARADLQAANSEEACLEDRAAHFVLEQFEREQRSEPSRRCVAGRHGDQVQLGGRCVELVQIELTAHHIGSVARDFGRAAIHDFDVIQPERQERGRHLPQASAQQAAAPIERRQRFVLRDVRAQAANVLPYAGSRVGQRK